MILDADLRDIFIKCDEIAKRTGPALRGLAGGVRGARSHGRRQPIPKPKSPQGSPKRARRQDSSASEKPGKDGKYAGPGNKRYLRPSSTYFDGDPRDIFYDLIF